MRPKVVTQEQEEEMGRRFYYDGKDLRFKVKVRGKSVGDLVGTQDRRGYRQVSLLNKKFLVHRIVYFLFTGEWPECVDHIDGDKTNNSIENLRGLSKSENCFHKVSGYGYGVRKTKFDTFEAYGSVKGSFKSLGNFKTEHEARQARERFLKERYSNVFDEDLFQ